MAKVTMTHATGADAVVMAAAVADYTPERPLDSKMPKGEGPLQITLVRTRDILADLGRQRGDAPLPVLVGFAAETGDPRPRARQKLQAKQVDLIVANDVSRADGGFDVDTNAATLISASGEVDTPVQLKSELASTIVDRIEQLLSTRAAAASQS